MAENLWTKRARDADDGPGSHCNAQGESRRATSPCAGVCAGFFAAPGLSGLPRTGDRGRRARAVGRSCRSSRGPIASDWALRSRTTWVRARSLFAPSPIRRPMGARAPRCVMTTSLARLCMRSNMATASNWRRPWAAGWRKPAANCSPTPMRSFRCRCTGGAFGRGDSIKRRCSPKPYRIVRASGLACCAATGACNTAERSAAEECAPTGVDRSAGGQHVIHQHDPFAADHRLGLLRHAKCCLYVAGALGAGESDLLRRLVVFACVVDATL